MFRHLKMSLAAMVMLGLSAAVVLAGKPPKTPPTPPPVTYALKTFSMPAVATDVSYLYANKMTGAGVVVGYYGTYDGQTHPYVYYASTGADVAVDLNTIGVVGLPGGTRIATALGINELGFVVGSIEEISSPGVWRGYLLNLATNQLTTLPDGPNHTYARRINDNMDILGVSSEPSGGAYRAYLYNPWFDTEIRDLGLTVGKQVELSNPPAGQPATVVGDLWNGNVFRYVDGLGLDPTVSFSGHASGVSPSGEFCGSYAVVSARKTVYSAFRFPTVIQTFSETSSAAAINGDRDFVSYGDPMLYHQGTGFINFNSAVVGSPDDLNAWNSRWYLFMSDMTERGATNPNVPNFPSICGRISSPYDNRGFVLVPVTPPVAP